MAKCGHQHEGRICIMDPSRHAYHTDGEANWPNPEVMEEARVRRNRPQRRTANRQRFTEIVRGARGARDEAITRVAENTSPEFRDRARQALREVAQGRSRLTAEDVQDHLGMEAHDNRAWGAIMLWGVREGLIAKTDPEEFVQSRYPRRHLMDVRVWRSLVCES